MVSPLSPEATRPEVIARVAQAIALFPLPRVVLMPGALLPLHVFEARYQALIRHCLERERYFAVGTLKPGCEEDYFGEPEVYDVVGIGHIVSHQPFEDGRSNLVVQSVARADIVEALASPHPFRLVRAAIRPDIVDTAAAVERLRLLILQIGGGNEGYWDEALRLTRLPSLTLVDELARKVFESPEQQRRYLGLDRLSERAAAVVEQLAKSIDAGDVAAGEA